ncbi:Ectoine hydroxylase-related dioxygenase, phytanoyl-CoA dioxygenase (PhyH) family [Roseivivax lentus]|uniref:Ectoine hydroxylase-related dioxygenase, phytanoyl-CoA dioxygenase (PhyH) family n=1 Tax=Roseivivax lentus TaxID=633194 RepID=A0A1N7LNR1_9RHOB|nr:phytanoyl-CoA dioxygenase family protein [Roseivivax lentus]SIS75468.1 Ectoine hydroxylase-related dioxygenase, phytanoyl-CoA dioxygenase (PhyH) family [Roseivivax lentus]
MKDVPQGPGGYYDAASCTLADFAALTARSVDPAEVPHAAEVAQNIPVYDMVARAPMLERPETRRALMAEWARILHSGAGVFVLKAALTDQAAIDTATGIYTRIIAEEKAARGGGADHFAAAGSNDRIWNSLQKLCLAAPATFLRFFASPAVDAACEAWLGPFYQMTAQINLVHPGGAAQQAHRDYHLGFQTAEVCATYPAHVHDLSPLMTLQGGIAHCDMPVESGPTKLLPFSQLYKPGYAAWRRDDFRAHFEAHHVQLPLSKGDALFFNPALFHAAGSNRSADVHRMVNLLQVSSAFGRAMESVDRAAMCRAVFPALKTGWSDGTLSRAGLAASIAATAEGYSFPTNLDRDPPAGGLAPETQAALLTRAVEEGWMPEALDAALAAQAAKRRA